MQAPRSSTGSPLIRSPRAGSTSIVRMPKRVDSSSSTAPSDSTTRPARVEGRGIDAPPLCVLDEQTLPERLGPSGVHRQRGDVARDDRPRGVDELGRHGGRRRDQRLVLEHGRHRDHGTVVDGGCRDLHRVEREVHGSADHEVHGPVDAGTRVPPGVVVGRRVDRDHVLLAVAEVLADRHREVGVAVRPVAGERAVDPDRGAPVHALELEQDSASRGARPRRRTSSRTPRPRRGRTRCPSGRQGRAVHRAWRRAATSPPPRASLAAAEQLEEVAHLRADAPVVVERGTDHEVAPDSGNECVTGRRGTPRERPRRRRTHRGRAPARRKAPTRARRWRRRDR